MARIKLDLPAQFGFRAQIPVRIQDVNYGGHVGNDAILSILHEARIQYLASLGLREHDPDNTSLIMADVAIVYKGEGFHGDTFDVEVAPAELSPFGFELYYRISSRRGEAVQQIAEAKTGMVCFDYRQRKLARLTEEWKQKMS